MKMYKAEKIGNITLICGDCMEVMRDMNANAYDLAICDPPYGIGLDMRCYGLRKMNNTILTLAIG